MNNYKREGNMGERSERKHLANEKSEEDPPNSRLFVICSKHVTDEILREEFSKFGQIEEIWIVRDRNSGESKGVAYIKFSKTSEAAYAMETMNGKVIPNCSRRLRVVIAASRDQGSKREDNEEERLHRLFVLVPKTMSEDELYEIFNSFGEVDYANIIRDRDTKESKGFAYVKYFKFSSAAKAFEECDRKFKPVFAEPRKPRQETSNVNNNFSRKESYTSSHSKNLVVLPTVHSEEYFTKLQVLADPFLNQDQLWKLFDIVPGMEFCEVRPDTRTRRNIATVAYDNHQSAVYAKEKLHGFEYPPGSRLIVKPEPEPRPLFEQPQMKMFQNKNRDNSLTSTLATKGIAELAETIAKATSILQAAKGIPGISDILPETAKLTSTLCSVSLPDPKPLADIDAECVVRLFIVCSPNPPPTTIMRDVFCRFGDLIDVYMLNNRNCGYAKYASKESAENAMKTMHGADVVGNRLKVIPAEEPRSDRKRMRFD